MSKEKFRELISDAIKQRAEMVLEKRERPLFVDGQPYYFVDYQDNLLNKMSQEVCDAFARGSGDELQRKMAAVYSSSAMTFDNFNNSSVQVGKLVAGRWKNIPCSMNDSSQQTRKISFLR